MEALKETLKQQIIEHLNLEELTIADFPDDEPLFGENIGLDSIDSLELIVLLENEYGAKLSSPEEGKQVFHSVNSLAEFISSHHTK